MVSLLLASATAGFGQRPPIRGPLRVTATNPHWFVDGSGRAVLLAGSHTWGSLKDNGIIVPGATSSPPRAFDYYAYLGLLAKYGHNFFRLWRWETTREATASGYGRASRVD